MSSQAMILSGDAHPELARAIAHALGWPLGETQSGSFADGETRVKIASELRGKSVAIVQPTCTPVDHHLMMLLLMADAARAAGARRVVAVMPYFGYGRQEVRGGDGDPRSAQLVGRMLAAAAIDQVVTLDLHVAALESVLPMPVVSLQPQAVFAPMLRAALDERSIFVSPDAGGMKRAQEYGNALGCGIAATVKVRPEHDVVATQQVMGDVAGKRCILVDDMASTGRTLVAAAEALLDAGAIDVSAVFTHAVLAPGALDRLADSPLTRLITSDSIPVDDPRIEIVTCAGCIAEALRNLV